MITALLALFASTAMAQDSVGAVTLGGGVGQFIDSDAPVSMRISLAGEANIVQSEAATLAVLVPLELDRNQAEAFGVTATRYGIELPVSLRVGLLPGGLARPIIDLGFGPTYVAGEVSTVFGTGSDSNLGWVARGSLGVQVGASESGGIFVQVEPAGYRIIGMGDDSVQEYVAQASIGVRL